MTATSREPGRPGPIVFLGTSAFAVPSLRALHEAGEVVSCVVSQPDRPRGRGRQPEPPPVSSAAQELGLTLRQPESVNAPDAVAELARGAPEFVVVVAYGQLLRRAVLELPAAGVINLHASLLPRHRGPSPVAWTILEGDGVAGNTTMLVDEGLDAGPVLLQRALALSPETTRGELEVSLAEDGARLLVETLAALRAGNLRPKPQDPASATWSRKLTRELRPLRWDLPAAAVRRLVHALSPAPAALARLGGRLVKVLRVAEVPGEGEPGRVVRLGSPGPVVACGVGALALVEVQPEGRRPMSGADFARGGGLRVGDLLETPADG